MSMNVQPDLDFIKDIKSAGGDTLKKCFQCATCSVVCPLSSDDNPFPRREMVFAQWGLKEKLVGDPNIMLCHQCGDCTAYCPRGAKPGDVLGAIRAYTYKYFGWPAGLAKLASAGKNMPVLIGIPAVIIFVVWLISGGMTIPSAAEFARDGYGHFFGHWDFRWLAKNVFFIDLIILPTVALSIYAAYRGVSAMWQKMAEGAGVGEALYRPSVAQFVKELLWPSLVEIVQHTRFKKCVANADRIKGHLPLLLSFLALFFVTVYSAFTQDFLGIFIPSMHGPLSMWNPVKILANVGAIALIVGVGILWGNRSRMEMDGQATHTFYDWFLIWMIMGVGVTGLAAELLRLIGVASVGYVVYYLHLISVMMLFLYMPYTKFAHLVYRTFAMAFERYRDSAYVKNPLN
ncbi:sn-glycerol-3-phosphate dehydrogenase subunit C [bacterium BMS3Bbin14]|nr:sn-glycerol-3-phosphate dehydrogenase subunit C [bacterium BMS3Abin13]GBE52215.1 sn-glycerol-3-phosphate dehydrogenase subunit C [bacterium BMS3Bbin14]HDK44419.1 heterodisulfide reductase [Desulfobacteraceae bacterium]HDL98110.1 heterodisulfide reductase [Desulfobacteraceae bacterium]HDZ75917.1 heterodisulfide reductase [Desulfobacteraceae bacterium]